MDGSTLGSLGSIQPRALLQFHRRLVCDANPPSTLPRVNDSCSLGVGAITATAVSRLDLLVGKR